MTSSRILVSVSPRRLRMRRMRCGAAPSSSAAAARNETSGDMCTSSSLLDRTAGKTETKNEVVEELKSQSTKQ